ncbi:MAG TPA: glycosyltransferase family protein, partial [Cellvibrionaceae bacterium]
LQVNSGKVNIPKTVFTSNLRQLRRDIKALNVSDYDLVVSDFEPVSAWAAKLADVPSIGISHQSAFHYPIPKRANNPITQLFMRWFAPVKQAVGVHWHHFNQPLLPPIVEPIHAQLQNCAGKILVYLPFRELKEILALLSPVGEADFYIYHKDAEHQDRGHLHLRRFSRDGFQRDLHSAEGVICSAGFELPSEALQLGKKILAEPVARQMEQQSNALALDLLGYATTAVNIEARHITQWLLEPRREAIAYPDVAAALARWIATGCDQPLEALSLALWQQVDGVAAPVFTHERQQKPSVAGSGELYRKSIVE